MRSVTRRRRAATTNGVLTAINQEVGADLDLSIDITAWAEYWPKLKTSAAAGTPFDVMIMNGPNIMFHAANEILYGSLALRKSRQYRHDWRRFPAYLVNVYTLFGKVWGLPNFHATVGMYYNREHLGTGGFQTIPNSGLDL